MKIDITRQLKWYAIFNTLSQQYPFESIEFVVNKTNEIVDNK